jgi:uncharacterized membrane protein (UPF0127 family)
MPKNATWRSLPEPTSHKIASMAGIITVLAAVALTAWPQRGDCPVDNPETSVQIGDAELQVEIAADNRARHCGLAFRDKLPADTGMLFVYARDQTLVFWMKDTRIPLALAFIDTDRRITEIHQLTPDMGERRVVSAKPARFALETNPGWFEANQVSVGDRVEFHLPDDLLIE